MMARLPILALALCCAGLAIAPARAVQVNDVRPERVTSFVQADRVTVVLFTSPDDKCTYCVGQDGVFNDAATHYREEPPVFAYVRWRPWHVFPKLDLPRPIRGLPAVKIFRGGEVLAELDGRFTDPAKLIALVDQALAGKLEPLPHEPPAGAAAAASAAPAPPAPPLTDADRRVVSLYLRQQQLGRVSKNCVRSHPAQAADHERALAAWQSRFGEAAARGGALIQSRIASGAPLAPIDPIAQVQLRQIQQQLPLPAPTAAADCERVHRFIEQDSAPAEWASASGKGGGGR